MSERHKRIHEVNTDFRAGETEDETVITIETSPAFMPPAWVNFLKQRLHLLHLDCKGVDGMTLRERLDEPIDWVDRKVIRTFAEPISTPDEARRAMVQLVKAAKAHAR